MEGITAAGERQRPPIAVDPATITAMGTWPYLLDVGFDPVVADERYFDIAGPALLASASAALCYQRDLAAASRSGRVPTTPGTGLVQYGWLSDDPQFGIQIDPRVISTEALATRWPSIIEALKAQRRVTASPTC
jgi:hypothetical protein